MSDRDRRTPPPVPGAKHQPEAAAGVTRERLSGELDQLIEDFCAATRAAAERPPAIAPQPITPATPGRARVAPRLSLATLRLLIARQGRREADPRVTSFFIKAAIAGFAVGVLAFALIQSDLLPKPGINNTDVNRRLAIGSALRPTKHTPPHDAPLTGADKRGTATVTRPAPALTEVFDRPAKLSVAPSPPAGLSLPEFRFSTWPIANKKLAQAETPAKRWDFLNSATGAITPKPSGPLQAVPLPTRPDQAARDQHRGDEKPLADEKPISGEPDKTIAGAGSPAGRDRARVRKTVRRRTTRKFLLGRGTTRKPRAKTNPALRPSTEPSPQPRPKPARVPRADARTGHQLRLGEQPRPGSSASDDFLGFIRPTPRPDWARRAIEN